MPEGQADLFTQFPSLEALRRVALAQAHEAQAGAIALLWVRFGFEASKPLDENTLVEFDADRNLCAITVEHASDHAALPKSRLHVAA